MLTLEELNDQERRFADAFGARDVEIARPLYHPDVVYVSPTVRLFDQPPKIEGIDATLAFIRLTIEQCRDVVYEAVELACLPDGTSGFVRVHFDWNAGRKRLRSNYVVLYRYREEQIAGQEIYYDPSGQLEVLEDG